MEAPLTAVFALTLTYRTHYYVEPKRQFQDTISEVTYNFRRCAKEFIISPELHVNGNIHYHCTIWVHDLIKFYKSVLPKFKRNGHIVIKKDPNDKWTEYIYKDTEKMSKILDVSLPITEKTERLKFFTSSSLDEGVEKKSLSEDITNYYL